VSVNPLEIYLTELREIRDTGAATKETSGYGTLAKLLDAVGQSLKPKVRCLIQLKNSGAGLPDGGLFTPDQLKNADEEAPLHGLNPARGVIEVKAASEELADIAPTEQVKEYLAHYGQVLLTNYRDFLLLKRGPGGAMQQLESFRLADGEAAFWAAAAHPRKTADALGERFVEYLKRVMLHAAPLNSPRDLAFFLASYARDARARVEHAGDLPALTAVRTALEEALGMKFEAEKGEHFFRSTLVQTLFYGVFSAWVLWHKEKPQRTDAFDWKAAAWTLHVPMIKALFEQVATPTKLGPLGLVEVLDWTATALNRVERPAFFEKFLETHAVQYFYEPFLEAFDPELRKELGVWYTPPEIVEYQVARVDAVLREELDIPDGLADPRVFVLDPCCGTGAYLVEVLRHIYRFLKEDQCMGVLSQLYTKQAAQERVFGFELLPAPFVVAHLQLGLLLQSLEVPLDDAKNERAAIYLTNSLTGWEPPSEDAKKQLTFPIAEFQAEKEAADQIKQEKRIIVILGNPPYNGFAGVAVEEERDLTNAYRTTKRVPAPQGQGLNDLYVRFFRMAERRIVEKSGEGIISFISNYSWLDGLSFTGMRERYLEVFDSITVDCLNGDKYKTGKLTPEGAPDPSVFSTEFNREGIQVGTAIATVVFRSRSEEDEDPNQKERPAPPSAAAAGISFRHLWGKNKRAELLKTLDQPREEVYTTLRPRVEVGLPFLPAKTASAFFKWPLLPELFPVSFPGVKTSRDDFLVDMDRDALTRRMEKYFDLKVSHDEMRRIAPSVMENTVQFSAELVRDELRKRGFLKKNIVRYCYRPFDIRWLYWEPQTDLLDRNRTEYFLQVFEGNTWIIAQQKPRREWSEPQFIRAIGCLDLMDRSASCFPLWLKPNPDPASLFDRVAGDAPKANLTDAAKEYLASQRLGNKPEALFYHTLAVLHSRGYRTENAGALRQDWPRVPLPKSREALLASAELGQQVAALLDTETTVPGVTQGKPRSELGLLAELHYSGTPDLRVIGGWGHGGKGGVTMPGKGKMLTRGYRTEEELEKPLLDLLGKTTHDIYLNDTAYWRNVPEKVWDYTIGGYQVLKKWLSYREQSLLGRALTTDEAREVTHIARRLAALILLQPELDANYQRVKAATHDWKSK
jgi:hypothetical protein